MNIFEFAINRRPNISREKMIGNKVDYAGGYAPGIYPNLEFFQSIPEVKKSTWLTEAIKDPEAAVERRIKKAEKEGRTPSPTSIAGEIHGDITIPKTAILFDQNDIDFLYQFPPRFWSAALKWRYNEGLREAAKNPKNIKNITTIKLPDWGGSNLEKERTKEFAIFKNIKTFMDSLYHKLTKQRSEVELRDMPHPGKFPTPPVEPTLEQFRGDDERYKIAHEKWVEKFKYFQEHEKELKERWYETKKEYDQRKQEYLKNNGAYGFDLNGVMHDGSEDEEERQYWSNSFIFMTKKAAQHVIQYWRQAGVTGWLGKEQREKEYSKYNIPIKNISFGGGGESGEWQYETDPHTGERVQRKTDPTTGKIAREDSALLSFEGTRVEPFAGAVPVPVHTANMMQEVAKRLGWEGKEGQPSLYQANNNETKVLWKYYKQVDPKDPAKGLEEVVYPSPKTRAGKEDVHAGNLPLLFLGQFIDSVSMRKYESIIKKLIEDKQEMNKEHVKELLNLVNSAEKYDEVDYGVHRFNLDLAWSLYNKTRGRGAWNVLRSQQERIAGRKEAKNVLLSLFLDKSYDDINHKDDPYQVSVPGKNKLIVNPIQKGVNDFLESLKAKINSEDLMSLLYQNYGLIISHANERALKLAGDPNIDDPEKQKGFVQLLAKYNDLVYDRIQRDPNTMPPASQIELDSKLEHSWNLVYKFLANKSYAFASMIAQLDLGLGTRRLRERIKELNQVMGGSKSYTDPDGNEVDISSEDVVEKPDLIDKKRKRGERTQIRAVEPKQIMFAHSLEQMHEKLINKIIEANQKLKKVGQASEPEDIRTNLEIIMTAQQKLAADYEMEYILNFITDAQKKGLPVKNINVTDMNSYIMNKMGEAMKKAGIKLNEIPQEFRDPAFATKKAREAEMTLMQVSQALMSREGASSKERQEILDSIEYIAKYHPERFNSLRERFKDDKKMLMVLDNLSKTYNIPNVSEKMDYNKILEKATSEAGIRYYLNNPAAYEQLSKLADMASKLNQNTHWVKIKELVDARLMANKAYATKKSDSSDQITFPKGKKPSIGMGEKE